VYNRAIGGASWASVEDYLETPTMIGYTKAGETFGHYVWTSGHWLGNWVANDGWAYYQDWFGVEIGTVYYPAALPKPAPEYLGRDEEVLVDECGGEGYVPVYALLLQAPAKGKKPGQPKQPPKRPKPAPSKPEEPTTPYGECLDACEALGKDLAAECRKVHGECVRKCRGNPSCIRRCDQARRACVGRVGAIVAGCIERCGIEHIDGGKGHGGSLLIPEGPYDSWCQGEEDDPRGKYPKLPTPGGGWPDYDKKKKPH